MSVTKVLLVEPIHEAGIKILRDAGLEVIVSPSTDAETLIRLLQDDIFGMIVRASKLDAKVLAAARTVKIVGRHGAGYNNIDIEAASARNILVANVPAANSYAVAEYVITAILLLTRKLLQGDAALRSGELSQAGKSLPGLVSEYGLGGNEAPGRCLGIIGYGKIGRKTAEMAAGFLQMQVIAYDPFVTSAPPPVKLVADVRTIYREADFITLHTLATKATENMIGAAELALMKPTACLINAGRGELVDEPALIAALKQGRIAGAVLDVFKEEPPRAEDPLFSAPNLLVTPHIAGVTAEAVEKLAVGSAQAVADWYCGKKPAAIVNPEVWERLELQRKAHSCRCPITQ